MIVATETTERFGAGNLEAVLVEQGRMQNWVAQQAGISESLISKVLKGQRTLSKPDAERVARVLGVPFFMLFNLRDRSTNGTDSENSDAD